LPELHELLAAKVDQWRSAGYPCDYPAVGEILSFAVEGEVEGQPFPASGSLRFLRAAQLRALETYWYLRVVEKTPHIADLYKRLVPRSSARRQALGLTTQVLSSMAEDEGLDALLDRIRTDDAFAAEHKLDALRETLTLDYPSYILALAIGAGKTILIGAIIATEFALASEYPEPGEGGVQFVENALVFAPGKTIIEPLRELARVPWGRILPPRLHRPFEATLKLRFTADGEKTISVVRGSSFNLVVTNTEKIRIQARPVKKVANALQFAALQEQAREEANLRLQAIASLPHLAVFSDEAHHTYGQALGKELKRVRQTVDYLKEHSPNLVCVVNTTGTPYFGHQPLKDVVVWYGLSQGIADGILKEVAGNVEAWNVGSDRAPAFVRHVVNDFFARYKDVALPDGAPAKLAIYFPQTEDLEELRPVVEMALGEAGLPTDLVLAHTSHTAPQTERDFNRLNDPRAAHRVVLLVNVGTEGWNCPSLFATALARKLSSSNNFVLQAASRCLRQVPGNHEPARIYLSAENRSVLDKQLQETYGESIADLDAATRATRRDRIVLDPAKLPAPPLRLTQTRTVVRRAPKPRGTLTLVAPSAAAPTTLEGSLLDVGPQIATRNLLRTVGDVLVITAPAATVDLYSAASDLAANFRVPTAVVLGALRRAYLGAVELPAAHLLDLARQVEAQVAGSEVVELREDQALDVVRPGGFEAEVLPDGSVRYTAEVSYPVDRAKYVFGPDRVIKENRRGYGFHYAPYNFDSAPEVSFFEQLVRYLNSETTGVADVYFVGAVTDPAKTDLTFEYRRADGKRAYYTPDFLVHCRDDRWMLVEIKRASARGDAVEGEDGVKANTLRALAARNPGTLDYVMVFASGDGVLATDLQAVRLFVQRPTTEATA